jgi:Leucine-rich repeat (LRR) protein
VSTSLPRAFRYQKNLQRLNLTGNRLLSLHQDTFSGDVRRTLRDLLLAHNMLQEVPRAAIRGLEDLNIINLSHNWIQKVDSAEFAEMGGQLTELHLAGCNLHEVGPVAFQGLSSLRLLDLQNNRIGEVWTFPHLSTAPKVPNRAFNNLRALETLRMGRNQLKTVDEHDFAR